MTQVTSTSPATSKATTNQSDTAAKPSGSAESASNRPAPANDFRPGRGGKCFVLEGEASDFRERIKKDTGVVSTSGTVSYWGGNDYCRLRDPEQLKLFGEKDWLRLEGDVREFDGNSYAGSWVITHVNGQPV